MKVEGSTQVKRMDEDILNPEGTGRNSHRTYSYHEKPLVRRRMTLRYSMQNSHHTE